MSLICPILGVELGESTIERGGSGGRGTTKLAQSAYVTAAHLWLLIFMQHSQLMGHNCLLPVHAQPGVIFIAHFLGRGI